MCLYICTYRSSLTLTQTEAYVRLVQHITAISGQTSREYSDHLNEISPNCLPPATPITRHAVGGGRTAVDEHRRHSTPVSNGRTFTGNFSNGNDKRWVWLNNYCCRPVSFELPYSYTYCLNVRLNGSCKCV